MSHVYPYGTLGAVFADEDNMDATHQILTPKSSTENSAERVTLTKAWWEHLQWPSKGPTPPMSTLGK